MFHTFIASVRHMIEDVEDDVYELSYSDFAKASTRVFDDIYNGEAIVLPSSKFLALLKHLGRVLIMRICRVRCGK